MPEENVQNQKRKVRSPEERAAEIESEIADYENKIAALKKKLDDIRNPMTFSDVIRMAKQQGVTPKELVKMAGLQQEESDS